MRKTGKKLVAVIAAVSMTISMVPSSGHATVRSISMQQAKASERSETVQGVVKQKAKDDTAEWYRGRYGTLLYDGWK